MRGQILERGSVVPSKSLVEQSDQGAHGATRQSSAWPARGALWSFALTLILLIGLTARAEASGGRIAFQTFYDDSEQIGEIAPDGSNFKDLTDFTDEVPLNGPVFSPDGHRVLMMRESSGFEVSGEVEGAGPRMWMMSDDGAEVGELGSATWSFNPQFYSGELGPSWSPDGNAVLFARFDEEGYSIVQVNTNGTGETVIVPPAEEAMDFPMYSPDGSKIAYSRGGYPGRQIHIVNADGTDDEVITHENGDVSSLSWSPNGREILFSVGERSHNGTSLDIIDSDGADERTIASANAEDYQPIFSPDGTEIAFARFSKTDQRDHLYTMNADGSDPRPVPNAPAGVLPGSWTATTPAGDDPQPPTVSCESDSEAWHASNISLACTAGDSASGLTSPADASFSLQTEVPEGRETDSAATDLRRVCDNAGGCVDAGRTVGIKIDRKAPTIKIENPQTENPEEEVTVTQGQEVTVRYHCSDAGSGVASCAGSTDSGQMLDTSTLGHYSLSVTATDKVGNTETLILPYTVVEPTFVLSGLVTTETASSFGVAGTEIIVAESGTSRVVAKTVTGWNDRYSVKLPAGTYDVTFTPPSGAGFQGVTRANVVMTTDTTLDIRLPGTGTVLEGAIADSQGKPVRSATVEVEGGPLAPEEVVASGPDSIGHYRMELAPGGYNIDVISSIGEGRYEVRMLTSLNIAEVVTQDVSLPAVGSVTIAVQDSHGRPISGADVEAQAVGSDFYLNPQGACFEVSASPGPTDSGPCITNQAGLCTISYPAGIPIYFLIIPAAGSPVPVSGTASVSGNTVTATVSGSEAPDVTPPTVTCGEAPAGWSDHDVSVTCTASDPESGLADLSNASFSLSTEVAQGVETSNASTGIRQVCDIAGNCATAGPITGIKVDRKPPTISLESPTADQSVPQGARVSVRFSCADEGSGVTSCEGTPAMGQPLDTSTLGAHTIEVTATDQMGNTRTTSFNYTVVLSGRIALTGAPNPSVYASKVSLTATVSPNTQGGPAPTGTVSFMEGSTILHTSTLARGIATYSTSTLGAGTHAIVAAYSGDTQNPPAESAMLQQIVETAPSELALTSSADPSTYGQAVNLKASVQTLPSGGAPTGSVTFDDNGFFTTVELAKGIATYHLPARDVGAYAITATYNGDINCRPSAPALLLQTVRSAQMVLALSSSSNPAVFGSLASLKAVVKTVAPGHGTPTGTITFSEGPTTLATLSLDKGSAAYPLGNLDAGRHTLTATYTSENEDFASAAPPSVNQAIEPAATKLTLTRSANPAKAGSEAYVKATLKAVAPSTAVPSGVITFSEGEAMLGVVPLEAGVAKLPVGELAIGEHIISATYGGELDFLASGSSSITQTIKP